MSSQLSIVLFVLASGFVTAALLNAIHQMLPGTETEMGQNALVLHFDSPSSIAWSAIICVFAGPYLVLSQGIYFWKRSYLPLGGLLFCGLVSVLWSFCSGVVVMESLIALGIAG